MSTYKKFNIENKSKQEIIDEALLKNISGAGTGRDGHSDNLCTLVDKCVGPQGGDICYGPPKKEKPDSEK